MYHSEKERCGYMCRVDTKRSRRLQIDTYNDFNALKMQLLNKLKPTEHNNFDDRLIFVYQFCSLKSVLNNHQGIYYDKSAPPAAGLAPKCNRLKLC